MTEVIEKATEPAAAAEAAEHKRSARPIVAIALSDTTEVMILAQLAVVVGLLVIRVILRKRTRA